MDDDLDRTVQDSSTGPWAKGYSGPGEQSALRVQVTRGSSSPYSRGLHAKILPPADNGAAARLVKQGSVDDCRHEIVNLLEGGREAFELRAERYHR